MTRPSSEVDALLAGYGFELDGFQRRAVDSLDRGRSVLVSAPTGSGKTVVAECAVADALDRGLRAFYTTPIKALSNQKFHDLRDRHGAGRVGLLTGDNSIDGEAPVVVMTTEVLRNMIYAGRDLDDLAVVVLDEVHYLQDTFRGPVWEEVIVHLPEHVQLVCLSATVSNAHDIGDWLSTVRGDTDVVVEDHRPVELANTYLVGDRSDRLHLIDTLIDGQPNPEGQRFDSDPRGPRVRGARGRVRPAAHWFTPSRLDVLDVLEDDDLLPAIVFIFSRAACDDAVRGCVDAGVTLTEADERHRIRQIAERHLSSLTPTDLTALDADRWLHALESGIAAHHAGHVPPFKEAVEACFAEGLVKVVFATEALALGVNMPARAVVIERLTKFNGERRETLTPGEYTQLTGRAGRRGIDTHGTAIVLWSPFMPFATVAALAGSRSFALRSAFRPTYNMTANLIRWHDRVEARRLLNLSLAQFQADRAVVEIERRLDRRRDALTQAEREASCELGDVESFAAMVAGGQPRRGDRVGGASPAEVHRALASLKPGDVVVAGDGTRAAVLSVAYRKAGAVHVRVIDTDGDVYLLDDHEVPAAVASMELPEPFQPDDAAFRAATVAALARVRGGVRGRSPARSGVDHPVAACPDADAHLRSWGRVLRLRSEVGNLERRVDRQTSSLSTQFDRVLEVLAEFGYVDGWSLTDKGELLAGVYHEAELVVAEALAAGCFDGLTPAELAAVASALVYEHRAPGPAPRPPAPTSAVQDRLGRLEAIVSRVQRAEERSGVPLSRSVDPGFAGLAHAWCLGEGLGPLLDRAELDLTGGDFVRTIRQLVDLVRQLGKLAPDDATRTSARRAVDALERGVVSASSVLRPEAGEPVGADESADGTGAGGAADRADAGSDDPVDEGP